MKIAVTGSTGHLGANVVRDFLAHGHSVRALYHPDASLAAIEGLDIEAVPADVLDPLQIRSAIEGMDAVIHLAAIISINGDPEGSVHRTNVEGPKNVAQACLELGVRKLVHVSSIHAFKSSKHATKLDENSPKADETSFDYDRSKAGGEIEILNAVKSGLNASILNPTGILGPHDYCNSLAGQMLKRMFEGRMPALVDAGFDWVDVRDVAGAIRNALEFGRKGEQYVISGRWISFRELATLCESVSGKPAPRVTIPIWIARLGLPFSNLNSRLTGAPPLYTHESLQILKESNNNCSCAKAHREFGYVARDLAKTIRDTYDWHKNLPASKQ